MDEKKTVEIFEKAPVPTAVLKNAVAAVSLATPVFLIFMAVGTIFGIGGTSVISRAMGEGQPDYAKKVYSFCMWSCVAVGLVMSALFLTFMD